MKTILLTVAGTVTSDKPTNAEIAQELDAKCADAKSAASALVEALREAGVNIQTATVAFGAPAASHEPPTVLDLAKVDEAPVTETASTGGAVPGGETAGG